MILLIPHQFLPKNLKISTSVMQGNFLGKLTMSRTFCDTFLPHRFSAMTILDVLKGILFFSGETAWLSLNMEIWKDSWTEKSTNLRRDFCNLVQHELFELMVCFQS
jgi:hypothetical protein